MPVSRCVALYGVLVAAVRVQSWILVVRAVFLAVG